MARSLEGSLAPGAHADWILPRAADGNGARWWAIENARRADQGDWWSAERGDWISGFLIEADALPEGDASRAGCFRLSLIVYSRERGPERALRPAWYLDGWFTITDGARDTTVQGFMTARVPFDPIAGQGRLEGGLRAVALPTDLGVGWYAGRFTGDETFAGRVALGPELCFTTWAAGLPASV